MNKSCVFDKTKICNECGDCTICDLNSKKQCNNCGMCLQLEGYDIRALKIDEVLEKLEDVSEYEELDKLHDNSNKMLSESENEEFWDYIDDIVELDDMMKKKGNLVEVYPGLITIKSHNHNKEES